VLFSIQCITCAAFHRITRVPNLAGAGNLPAETQARNVRASTCNAAVRPLLSMNLGNKSDVDAMVQFLELAPLRHGENDQQNIFCGVSTCRQDKFCLGL